MSEKKNGRKPTAKTLPKAATDIQGLDEITFGGLPCGRPTLISGGAGSGKTLFGMEFLVRGATQYGEPGVFISFEETIPDLTKNSASLGFDLDRLVADKKLCSWTTSTSREANLRKPASMTSMAYSFELPMLSSGSERSESSWTPLKHSSASCPTLRSCARKSVACSAGSSKKN
jgi:hypothetical protein